MTNDQPLAGILESCERLRRLPAARWAQPARPPLGAMAAAEPLPDGAPLQELMARCLVELMTNDATARHVDAFVPEVSVLALPDVVAALARSVSARGDAEGQTLLTDIAHRMRDW